MRSEFKHTSLKAGLFWYEAWSFFRDIGLLMETVANVLVSLGYQPIRPYYGVPFSANQPPSRLVYDRVLMHWMGTFPEPKGPGDDQIIHYGYGLGFGNTHPQAPVNPWIPLFYFFKAEMVGTAAWELGNWNKRFFDPVTLAHLPTKTGRYLVYFAADQLTECATKVKQITAIRIPLGALNSTEDVARIVGPVIQALRHNDESYLAELGESLMAVDETMLVDAQEPRETA